MIYTRNVSALKCGLFKVYDANLFITSIIKLLGKAMLKTRRKKITGRISSFDNVLD